MPTERTHPKMSSRTLLLTSLSVQGRVIHALLMREVITRFGRDNLGVLWLFVEPMVFTLGITALWTAGGLNHGSSLPITAFAITGYSSVLMWRNSATHCSMAINTNRTLLYHRNVTVVDVMLTRIIVEVAGASASFIILSTVFICAGWMSAPADLLLVVRGWLMLAWFGASLAMLIGAGTAYSEIVERLWHPAAYLLFPLSGAGFMVDWLPVKFQGPILTLPMVHGIEMVREGYFGNAVPAHYDVGYMVGACLLMTLVALQLARVAALRVEAQ